MERFEHRFRGYDKNQVNKVIDEIIVNYESLLTKAKKTEERSRLLEAKVEHYSKIEETLNRSIFTAESKSDQIKKLAREESEAIVRDARKNANRIINDALVRSQKIEEDADKLRRSVQNYKRKLKNVVEEQLEVIDLIDTVRPNDRNDFYD